MVKYVFNTQNGKSSLLFSPITGVVERYRTKIPKVDINGVKTDGIFVDNNPFVILLPNNKPFPRPVRGVFLVNGTNPVTTFTNHYEVTLTIRNKSLKSIFDINNFPFCYFVTSGGAGVNTLVELADTDVDETEPLVDGHGLVYDATSGTWKNADLNTVAGGEVNTTSNAGATGEGLALPKSGVDLPFKKLVGGTDIDLVSGAETVTINANIPALANTTRGFEYVYKAGGIDPAAGQFSLSGGTIKIHTIDNRGINRTVHINIPPHGHYIFDDNDPTTGKHLRFDRDNGISSSGTFYTITNVPVTHNLVDGDVVYLTTDFGGAVDLHELADVELTFPLTNGDILQYNNVSTKFENVQLPADQTNTLASVGVGGVSLVEPPSGNELRIKSINAGSAKITVAEDDPNNEIDIDLGTVGLNDLTETYTIGDILYANNTNSLDKLSDVAIGSVLKSGGVGVAPAYGQVDLTTDVTGVLPVSNGGTNNTELDGILRGLPGTPAYADINTVYSPDVRYDPSGLSGGLGAVNWIPSVGTVPTPVLNQGTATNLTTIVGKSAVLLPLSQGWITLDLNTNITNADDWTLAIVVNNFTNSPNCVWVDFMKDPNDPLGDPPNAQLLMNLSGNFRSNFAGVIQFPFSPSIPVANVAAAPWLFVFRGTSAGAYKVWANTITDSVHLDLTYDNSTNNWRYLRFGGDPAQVWRSQLNISEVLFWNSAITNETVANLSNTLLGEYAVRVVSPAQVVALKSEFTANTFPTSSADNTLGYVVGSRWIDTTANKEYVCVDASTGVADWQETTINSTDVLTNTIGHNYRWSTNTTPVSGEIYFSGTNIYISVEDTNGVDLTNVLSSATFNQSIWKWYDLVSNSVFYVKNTQLLTLNAGTPNYWSGTAQGVVSGGPAPFPIPPVVGDLGLLIPQPTSLTLTNIQTWDKIVYDGSSYVNRTPTSGQIKVNSFDTNLTAGAKPTYTGVTTEVEVTYRIAGETTLNLNASSFPTTSIPLVQASAGNPFVDTYFWEIGATQADDRFKQHSVQGACVTYRVELSYSNKPINDAGRIQLRLYNPDSGFSLENNLPLAQGVTADSGYMEYITISDSANVGAGLGYKFGVSSTTSVDIVIDSITAVSHEYAYRA